MTIKRTLLVTSALPYANGNLHLGHLVEHIQCDIWVRTHKMLGYNCISVCADDAHGTPIMLKAQNLNISPQELTDTVRKAHESDFKAFYIEYDVYHTTHSEENRLLVEDIYNKLNKNGYIIQKTINQAFDPVKNVFLPDRYVKGTCPKCRAIDQYGDNCEACGATYNPTDLIDPKSVLSNVAPIEKESVHYFFDLPQYENFLRSWVTQGHLQDEIAHKLSEWFEQGLKQWDISRDAPYFGFLIPGTQDKYFYVWLDAPIGYMASFKKYCDLNNIDFNSFCGKNSQAELYHFIGKDIVYFHALFWPALLLGSGYRLPTAIFAHGFLTVNGQKMSKSRGTFIEAAQYLEHLNPEYLRYYFATKLNGSVEDLDLNFTDFTNRINADLVGKTINIASRCAKFLNQYFANRLTDNLHDEKLYKTILDFKPEIINAYCQRDYALAIRIIMEAADLINQYIDSHKPWQLIKIQGNEKLVHEICSMGMNLFRLLMIYLAPVLPHLAQKTLDLLDEKEQWTFKHADTPLQNKTINQFTPFMLRVDKAKIDALLVK